MLPFFRFVFFQKKSSQHLWKYIFNTFYTNLDLQHKNYWILNSFIIEISIQ